VANHIGEPATVIAGALIALAFAVLLYIRMPQLRALE
jgi:hypothetical protein